MRLARLVHLEVTKLQEELASLKQKIAEYEAILASKKLQYDVVKKEILEIKKNYNTPRRSALGNDSTVVIEETKDEDESGGKNYIVAITAGNTIKKVTSKNYSMSQKSLTDNSTINDIPVQIESFTGGETILILTSQGNAIKTKVQDLKECKWRDKGASLLSIDKNIVLNEVPVKIMKMPQEGSVLFMTKYGMVKKSDVKDLNVNKNFYQVCKVNDGDEIKNIEIDKNGTSILMLTRKGMSLNFDKADIPTQGRISAGVKGINLDDDDSVIFAKQVDFPYVVVVTDNGFIKKLSTTQFPLSQRYRKGLRYINFAKNCKNVFFACDVEGNATLAVDFGLKILPMDTKKFQRVNA